MSGDDHKPAPLELDASFLTPLEPTPAKTAPAPLDLDASFLTPVEAPPPAAPAPAPTATSAPAAASPAAASPAAASPAAASPAAASPAAAEAAGEGGDGEGGPSDPLLEPLSVAEWIPEKFQKHVDGGQPPPVRLMAARAMVPMPPKDMVHVVFQAMFDPEKKIAALAKKTFKTLDEKILGNVLSEKIAPQVLKYAAKAYLTKKDLIEKVLLNRATPDEAFVHVAGKCEDHGVIAIVAGNQERLLRNHDIVRSLAANEKALRSDLDRAIDFLVREGVYLEDVDAFDDAFLRLGKGEMLEALKKIEITADLLDDHQKAMAAEHGLTAEELLTGNSEIVASIDAAVEGQAGDGAAPASGRRKPLNAYPTPVQIKLAMTGDHSCAMEAVHSTNRVVANAGIRNPKIRDSDVMKIVRSRSLADDVIRYICNNGDWVKAYAVKLALVQNPKTPFTLANRWLPLLRANDLKGLAKSKQIPSNVQAQAKKMVQRKAGGAKD